MSKWLRSGAPVFLILVCTVVALRHDLSQWQLSRADLALRNGDLPGAVASWSSAADYRPSRYLALLNRGVARYRLGELDAATADFRAATSAGDMTVRQLALYNLGTTLLVMEQKRNNADREGAKRMLVEAMRLLQAAEELNPADTDAVRNKALAKARLTALASGRPEAAKTRRSQEMGGHGTDAPKQPGRAGTEAGKSMAAAGSDTVAGQRRAAPALTPEQAMRMLDDARGREVLRSAATSDSRHEKLTQPDKDW